MKKDEVEFIVGILTKTRVRNAEHITELEGKSGEDESSIVREKINEHLHDLRLESDKCLLVKETLLKMLKKKPYIPQVSTFGITPKTEDYPHGS